ncbi:MAG: lytic transglycosylase domain-containing protein [Nitrospirota bacterium]|nr:lytic transglycosylase domain-containing protein [Nitrospirota bacterium]
MACVTSTMRTTTSQVGAKHLRYLLNRFHENIRLALAAYNADERTVDQNGQIPPYKETEEYLKQVLMYYRNDKKAGRVTPVVMAGPPIAYRPTALIDRP